MAISHVLAGSSIGLILGRGGDACCVGSVRVENVVVLQQMSRSTVVVSYCRFAAYSICSTRISEYGTWIYSVYGRAALFRLYPHFVFIPNKL